MEKEKYYTPEIEDIRVGYECEMESSWGWQKGKWPEILMTDTLSGFHVQKVGALKATNTGSLRVPYLTVEQIEAEGWIKVNDNTFVITSMKSDKFDSNVEYSLTFNRPRLTPYINIDGADADSSCYRGMCKSINELRTIMKLLRIN